MEPSLIELIERLHQSKPTFTVELFIRGGDARDEALTEDGQLLIDNHGDGNLYHSPTVFQLKTMLFHAGILSRRGSEPKELQPAEDVWKLLQPV